MQIIIPMSGFGERFRKAGYTIPKPLIVVEDKPIIAHVIDLFPGEHDFYFICNNHHLENETFNLKKILNKYCPTGNILGIEPHKLGPIHAVLQIKEKINLKKPTIVNYCDFTCYWDYSRFKETVLSNGCDGAIPAYKNFHPHTLGTTNYAYMKELDGWLNDIQEKKPFTTNRMNEFASSGTYYFKTAELMYNSFQATVNEKLNVGGEYYVSLAYKKLLNEDKKILVYPLQHFMQWGTPEDLNEYQEWSQVFRKLNKNDEIDAHIKANGTLIVPMAGLGKRFADEGYKKTKPLINVSGRSMVSTAIKSLPKADKNMFVLRKNMDGYNQIKVELSKNFSNSSFTSLTKLTDGQAITTLEGLKELKKERKNVIYEPITVAACDNAIVFNQKKYQNILDKGDFDVLVWGAINHANSKRYPEMFGWINYDQKTMNVNNISVKKPIDKSLSQPIVIGMFTFKNAKILEQSINQLMKNENKINNEFYLDSTVNEAINLGLNCKVFIIDHFISFGTPNDLKTFEYWQSCFSKWNSHPYSLSNDSFIPKDKINLLKREYAKFDA